MTMTINAGLGLKVNEYIRGIFIILREGVIVQIKWHIKQKINEKGVAVKNILII